MQKCTWNYKNTFNNHFHIASNKKLQKIVLKQQDIWRSMLKHDILQQKHD